MGILVEQSANEWTLAELEVLLQFAMYSVAFEGRIVLLLLKTLGMSLCVFSRCVTRWRLALFARFCALNRDDSDFAFFSHRTLRRK